MLLPRDGLAHATAARATMIACAHRTGSVSKASRRRDGALLHLVVHSAVAESTHLADAWRTEHQRGCARRPSHTPISVRASERHPRTALSHSIDPVRLSTALSQPGRIDGVSLRGVDRDEPGELALAQL